MMQNVEEMIRKYIAQNILFTGDGYTYPDTASFLEEGIIDSMNVLELVSFVEEHWCVTVQDEDIVPDNFDSVSKLAAFVRSRVTTDNPRQVLGATTGRSQGRPLVGLKGK